MILSSDNNEKPDAPIHAEALTATISETPGPIQSFNNNEVREDSSSENDNTSRTTNAKMSAHFRNNSDSRSNSNSFMVRQSSHTSRSIHNSKHSTTNSTRSNTSNNSCNKITLPAPVDRKSLPSSSNFEINCSPDEVSATGSDSPHSYYEQTRMRRSQSSKSAGITQIPSEDVVMKNTDYDKNTYYDLGPSSSDVEDDNEYANDDDSYSDSYSTMVGSAMALSISNHETSNKTTPYYQQSQHHIIDENSESTNTYSGDNTINSSNMDTNSITINSSNSISGASSSLPVDLTNSGSNSFSDIRTHNSSSNATINSGKSLASAVSRGEEHISFRMKKYGLFNLHEMKRKQQQRRAWRSQKPGNGISTISDQETTPDDASLPPPSAMSLMNASSTSLSMNTVSVNSALTEGLTDNGSGPNHGKKSSQPTQTSQNNSNNSQNNDDVCDIPLKIRTAPLHVQMAVEEIHRWLFTEGGHFEDVQTLMTQYSLYVKEHFGIPLDRLYYGGVGLHPKLTAYLWKWEANGEFTHAEMPPEVFARRNEIFSPDEPFCVLEQGRAEYVRIRDTDDYIPPDTAKWFRGLNYKDYFALPDIHRGISKGGLAWSTKSPDGFCDDDIQFFRMTHAALTTIMRLHTNDLVLNTLTDRMESEIDDRTEELAIANRKLADANEEISKHASKQLEHFACMSHEIRTPLNCIVGLSSLLLENDDLNEELMDTIHMVYNSADLVQGVVNDVLDYAKIESGHFEVDVKPNDLQTTLNGVVHSISNKVQAKDVAIRTSYDGRLSKTYTTDSRRLQQILYNILGNAAKFSREGTNIDFKVKIIDKDDNNRTQSADSKENDNGTNNSETIKRKIRFSIKDYGKGIEEKNFEKIFKPFSQASKETQTNYGGTGLGLSITKNLVARLGGTISIRSEIDKFTEFIVDLPYNEELADTSRYKEKMSETSIVILDPTERLPTAPPTEEDDFVPFPTSVIQQYDLRVMRCSSWGELESKLGLRANIRENYIILAHEDIEERQGILNVEKLVRKERCSWFTFGSESTMLSHHFKSLTGIFPSTLIDTIFELSKAQRGSSLSVSSFSSMDTRDSSRMHDSFSLEPDSLSPLATYRKEIDSAVSQEQQQQQPKQDDQCAILKKNDLSIVASPRPQATSSTKLTKKFATKYPPRDLKILVVDDNKINQKVLDRILKRLGVSDVSIVDNGKKAVDLSATTTFDCIFMDMEMPVMGGLEACKLITERDKEAARVTIVTAQDIEDIQDKADAAGAYGYISKPLKMKDVHEFLKPIENLKKNATPIVPTNNSNPSSNEVDPKEELKVPSLVSPKKRPTPPKKKRSTKVYPPRKLKVLIAEDNLINQKVLDRILKRVGVTDVTIVDDGKKAVDASESTKFDCILMDMQMPIMDGLEACEIIVERDRDKEDAPKIIFVTAHALVEFREKAMAAGAFDFITKPFKMEDIDNVLKTLEVTLESRGGKAPDDVPMATASDMGSSSSDESAIVKPMKVPKLVHSSSH